MLKQRKNINLMKNRNITLTTILLAFGIVALSQLARAVVPAPDGAYGPPAYGVGNTAEGHLALGSLTTGIYNNAVGIYSLLSLTTGNFNTATGAGTLLANTADQNTATGAGALLSNTTGGFNTANGTFALFSNTTGLQNTANGEQALFNNATGNSNTALGFGAGFGVTTANNVICIGATGANIDNSCFIGNIRDALVAPNAAPVLIDSAGKLGTTNGSSRRFKKEIQPMDSVSQAILALKPVTFHYKNAPAGAGLQFGLIAEEVAEVNPDLVVRDKNGEIYTVRYEAVNSMLLNEFLKEHSAMQVLRKQVAALTTTVKEQASQIKKVSAQLQLSKPAPTIVAADR